MGLKLKPTLLGRKNHGDGFPSEKDGRAHVNFADSIERTRARQLSRVRYFGI